MTHAPAALMRAFTVLLLLCATGCDTRSSAYRITSSVPVDPDGFSNALFQSTAVELQPGHQVELLGNGVLFERLEEEISRAERSINIVLFVWKPNGPSRRIVEALTARARAGVACRVLIDPVASMAFAFTVKHRLVAAGCDVRAFRPVSLGITDNRNHRKIVVIDGKVGFTGGFGIGSEWLGNGLRRGEWRESSVVVRGPAVKQMQQAFADNWQEVDGPLLPPTDFPPQDDSGPTRAGFVSSTASPHLTRAERLTQLMMAAASKRLWIANTYFIPSPGMIDLLVQKRREGVDVRVMTVGDHTDHPFILLEQRATYPKLLENGVRIWEYEASLFHPKTMIVDDHLSLVGSINLDRLSLAALEEGALVMSDPRIVSRLVRDWEDDVVHCVEVGRPSRSP